MIPSADIHCLENFVQYSSLSSDMKGCLQSCGMVAACGAWELEPSCIAYFSLVPFQLKRDSFACLHRILSSICPPHKETVVNFTFPDTLLSPFSSFPVYGFTPAFT